MTLIGHEAVGQQLRAHLAYSLPSKAEALGYLEATSGNTDRALRDGPTLATMKPWRRWGTQI
jgi:hypothetical protein